MSEQITSIFQLQELIEKETMIKDREVSANVNEMDVIVWAISGNDAEEIASIDIYDFIDMTLEYLSIKGED